MNPARPTTVRLIALFVVIAAIIAAGIVATVLGRPAPASASGRIAIEAGTETCGRGWTEPRAGDLTFALHNTTIAAEEVYLEGADDGLVYADVEAIGPATTHDLQVRLSGGRYRFVCMPDDLGVVRGPVVTVAGTVAHPTPGVKIVTAADLVQPTKDYQAWVQGRLPALEADVQQLADAVSSGDRVRAQSAWLTAHLEYETLGAAYGTFGDLDTAINGTPASGTTALDDPDLTGFHRIEALLFGGAPVAAASPYCAQLASDVTTLQSQLAGNQIPLLDVGLRAHEILENAVQFELTGATDAGSHTSLATVGANIAGTRQALAPLQGLLKSRYTGLGDAEKWLDRSETLIDGYRRPDGSWTPLSDLTTTQRETLNATLGQTVELLAPVAAITEPRQNDRIDQP